MPFGGGYFGSYFPSWLGGVGGEPEFPSRYRSTRTASLADVFSTGTASFADGHRSTLTTSMAVD